MAGSVDFFWGGFDGVEETAGKFLSLRRQHQLLVGAVLVTAIQTAIVTIRAAAPVLTGATAWAVSGKVIKGPEQSTAVIGPKHAKLVIQRSANARGQTKLVATRQTKTGRTVRVRLAKGGAAVPARNISRSTVVDPGKYAELVDQGHAKGAGKAAAAAHPWFSNLMTTFSSMFLTDAIAKFGKTGTDEATQISDDLFSIAAISSAQSILQRRSDAGAGTRGNWFLGAMRGLTNTIVRAKTGVLVGKALSHLAIANAKRWHAAREENRKIANEVFTPRPFPGAAPIGVRASPAELAHYAAERAKFNARAGVRAIAQKLEESYRRHDERKAVLRRLKKSEPHKIDPIFHNAAIAIRRKSGFKLLEILREHRGGKR